MPKDTTYEVVLPLGDKVEIGDKSSVDFKPHIKLNRWDGECFIAVKPANLVEEEIEYEVDEDKVKCKYKVKYEDDTEEEFEAEFYPLEPRTIIAKDKDGKDVKFKQCELGGFEFEVILKKKPKTNKIVLDIETQGLKFYYQPELTPEEIAEGCVRPDNVVGSYAVYHATKSNHIIGQTNYRDGIAFHIYRPKITDALGKWVWGELSLDERAGTLTTTIPQDFLDSAVYPISTGTTNFGFEIKGGTSYNILNYIMGSKFPATAGTPISVTAYILNTSGDPQEVEYGVYLDSDASRVAFTDTPGTNTVPGDHDANYLINLGTVDKDLTAADHHIVWWNAAINLNFYFNTVVGSSAYDAETFAAGSFPNPWAKTVWGDRKFTIFCTYTAAAGETYEESCSDGIKIGDTLATQCVFGVSVTDGMKGSESTSQPLTIPKSASDGIKVGDSPVGELLLSLLLSDGLKVGDLPSLFLTIPCAASDGVKLGEVLATLFQAYPSLTDGLKAGDAPSTIGVFSALAQDGIELSDTAIVGLALALLVTDGIKLSDVPATLLETYPSLTDGVKLSDENILEILRILKLLLKMLAYRSLLIECKAYRDVSVEPKHYRELDVTGRAYRDISVDIRAHRGIELEYRG